MAPARRRLLAGVAAGSLALSAFATLRPRSERDALLTAIPAPVTPAGTRGSTGTPGLTETPGTSMRTPGAIRATAAARPGSTTVAPRDGGSGDPGGSGDGSNDGGGVPPIAPPPLPTPSPSGPECPEEAGAADLPAPSSSIDLTGDGGAARDVFSKDRRLWFSTSGDDGPAHLVGIDPLTGDRIDVATERHDVLLDVGGSYAYVMGPATGLTQYDVSTGSAKWSTRWRTYEDSTGSHTIYPVAARADATGAWVLFFGGPAFAVVLRYRTDGTVAWQTALDGAPRGAGLSYQHASSLAMSAGNVYVVMSATEYDPDAVAWRLASDGTVQQRSDLGIATRNVSVPIEATPLGVYAVPKTGDNADSTVLRLDPLTLVVTATVPVDTVESVSVSDGAVYTMGAACSFMLSRFDPLTLQRTGFWRHAHSTYTYSVAVHAGVLWLLHTFSSVQTAVALRSYGL